MVDKYPVDMKKLHSRDYQEWATEGYNHAVNDVYAGFVTGEAVSIGYKVNAEAICKDRIMYGGRRLADLLVNIFEH